LVEQLLTRVTELETALAQRDQWLLERDQRIAELECQLGADSANSSRPPSSDAPWAKKPAKKRSSRTRSGRKPGKQPGAASASRTVIDNPDEVFEVAPDCCARCEKSLAGAQEASRIRRQVVDASPPPPPTVTEYQLVSRRCDKCGHVSEPTATDVPRPLVHGTIPIPDTTTPGRPVPGIGPSAPLLPVFIRGWRWRLRPGSPVRIGSRTQALAVLLTCGHYLPIGRARSVLDTVAGVRVSTEREPTGRCRRRGSNRRAPRPVTLRKVDRWAGPLCWPP
jgi:hypothetical protein